MSEPMMCVRFLNRLCGFVTKYTPFRDGIEPTTSIRSPLVPVRKQSTLDLLK